MNPFIIGAAVIGGILYLIREDETKDSESPMDNAENERNLTLLNTQEEIRKLRGQLRKAERTKKSLIKSGNHKK